MSVAMRSETGHILPLLRTELCASARGGLASVLVRQIFENPHDEALSVVYSLPLPADSVVGGFSVLLQGERITGEVDRRARARARYRRALRRGHTAALVEQERSSLFTQEVANVPPRSSVTVEVLLDQRLRWLPDGAWEWRFPTVVAPRYSAAHGRGHHALAFSQEPLSPALSLSLTLDEPLTAPATSPSHAIASHTTAEQTVVTLTTEVRKDQDVVVRWSVATEQAEAGLAGCRAAGDDGEAFGLLTLTPPGGPQHASAVPRDLILLLDISGSMSGAPLQQMKDVAIALIHSLGADDQLEVLAFSTQVRRWRAEAVRATEAERSAAIAWVTALQASGGTEMRAGIIQALAPLRAGAQRQVILMTDGLIDFEADVIREVHARLPSGSRVHTLGIGGAVNRSLTAPVARAGGGVEQIVGLRESAARAAERLVARTDRPLVVGLRLGGSALLAHAPARPPDLHAGAPSLLALKLRPEGGALWIEGDTVEGPWRRSLEVAPLVAGEGEQGLAALYAREVVEDLELAIAAGEPRRACNQRIEDLGLAFQISTRLTSWIAVREVADGRPAASRPVVLPQDLPDGPRRARSRFGPYRAIIHRRRGLDEHQTREAGRSTRNVGFTSAPDAGATTLAEVLVYCAERALGESEGAVDVTMDCLEMERERGMYIEPVATSCEWDGHGVNLVNIPRYAVTAYEADCVRSAADALIVVVDAVKGDAPRSLRRAVGDEVPCLVFINKLDRPGSADAAAFSRLQDTLGRIPLRLQIPVKVEDELRGVIDVVDRKMYVFEATDDRDTREGPVPDALRDEVEQRRRELLEALSGADDEALAAFVDERPLSGEQLKAIVRRLCLACRAVPVFLGAAFRHRGMEALLQGMVDYLPGPHERVREAIDEQQRRIALESSDERPFVGRVFRVKKMLRSRLSFLRIYQGRVARGDTVHGGADARGSRVSRLVRAYPDEDIELEDARAGDIVALGGVDCAVGDTLTDGRVRCTMASAPVPEAVVSVRIAANDKLARARMQQALAHFTQEDPALRVRPTDDPDAAVLLGADELHLEIYLERLRREYQCMFTAGALEVERRGELVPWMEIEVTVPDGLQAGVMIALGRRHGLLTDVVSGAGTATITAEIAMDDLLGYRDELRSSSRGHGELIARFLRFGPRRLPV